MFSYFNSVNIPNYSSDSPQLQLKSLQYVFKRLKLLKLAPFLKDDSLNYLDHYVIGEMNKLDKLYDLPLFILLLTSSEFRIMVDYPKNKFRAFCLLSFDPDLQSLSDALSQNGGSGNGVGSDSSNGGVNSGNVLSGGINSSSSGYPPLLDHKDRPSSKFRFIYFPSTTSFDKLSHILATSDIYLEHFLLVTYTQRLNFAKNAIIKVIGSKNNINLPRLISDNLLNGLEHNDNTLMTGLAGGKSITSLVDDFDDLKINSLSNYNSSAIIKITDDEKKKIIEQYLHTIAFCVQTMRIYFEHLKNSSPPRLSSKKSFSNLKSPRVSIDQELRSPIKAGSTDSSKLSRMPSINDLDLRSPTKLSLNRPNTQSRSHDRPSSPTRPHTPIHPRPHTPTNRSSTSPVKLVTSPKKLSSTSTSSSSSPIKYSKPAISKIQLEELYNPVTSPQPLHGEPVAIIEREDIYDKCKIAIKHRLKQEKAKIQSTH